MLSNDRGRYRKIMNIEKDIPDEVEEQVHDILITFIKPETNSKKKHAAKGALKKYADPSKWVLEEGTFERAVVEKYAAD